MLSPRKNQNAHQLCKDILMSASSMRRLPCCQNWNCKFSRLRSRPDSTTAIVRTRIHNSLPIHSFFEHSSPPFNQLQKIEIRMQRQSFGCDPTKIVHSPPPPPTPPLPLLLFSPVAVSSRRSRCNPLNQPSTHYLIAMTTPAQKRRYGNHGVVALVR